MSNVILLLLHFNLMISKVNHTESLLTKSDFSDFLMFSDKVFGENSRVGTYRQALNISYDH